MLSIKGYAAKSASTPLEPFSFERREVGPNDVLIEIDYCGICHSDIHNARNEWGGAVYPMVPGHEIVGHVTKVGTEVRGFKPGDLAGVGCFVSSCRTCSACADGEEQYCQGQLSFTYNSLEKDGKTATQGGYSTHVVTDQNYVLRIPKSLEFSKVAPLLCAGITTYSPMKKWNVSRGQRVGIVGLGGLGHMAVKFGAAFGAEVTVFSTSPKKEADARRLGAHDFQVSNDAAALAKRQETYDFILDTVSAPHDLATYLNLLKRDGTLCLVGVPPKAPEIHPFLLIGKRRRLAGSLIGGIRETQEMLDFCGKNGITSDVEVIPAREINTAYERTLRADVRYRFVIDAKTF